MRRGERVPVLPIAVLPAAGGQDPPVAASLVSLGFGWCLLPPDNAESRPGCCWRGGELLAGVCVQGGVCFLGVLLPQGLQSWCGQGWNWSCLLWGGAGAAPW